MDDRKRASLQLHLGRQLMGPHRSGKSKFPKKIGERRRASFILGDSSKNYILGNRRKASFILDNSSRFNILGNRRRRARPASSWARAA